MKTCIQNHSITERCSGKTILERLGGKCGGRSAENAWCGKCGVRIAGARKVRSAESAEFGLRSVESAVCGKYGVRKMRCVENTECGK